MAEVAVVGGGPVGPARRLLARRVAVTLLEPQPPQRPAAGSPLDARVVALSRASENLLKAAGAWDGIAGERLASYERMCVWHESVAAESAAALIFEAADVGEPNLGYILENRLLQGALLEAFSAAGGSAARPLAGLTLNADGVTLQHRIRRGAGAARDRGRRGALGGARGRRPRR